MKTIEYHKNLIQKYTQETDKVIENALRTIYERSAEVTLNHLATIWPTFTEETKLEVAVLSAGRYHALKFIMLMEGLVAEQNSKRENEKGNENV